MMADLSPDDPRHGTENLYRNHGCRCPSCRAAKQDAERSRERNKVTRPAPVITVRPPKEHRPYGKTASGFDIDAAIARGIAACFGDGNGPKGPNPRFTDRKAGR